MILQQLYDGMPYILITGIQQSFIYHLFILEMPTTVILFNENWKPMSSS